MKNIQKSIFKKLHRTVENKERYYYVSIHPTLFGEYRLERIYGACSNSKPTRIITQYFESHIEALKVYKKIMTDKINKGYEL